MAELLILVGPPGSGKSSVGALLADLLGVGFRDTDIDIETTSGRTVSDIFIESGEAVFRELEEKALTDALAKHVGVLAVGGGAVMSAANRHSLLGRQVVFLDVGLAEAMRRLEMNRSRPLLLGNVRTQWQTLSDLRRPLYEEVAQRTILTDGKQPEQVAEEAAQGLNQRAGKSDVD
ncbi:MAG: shikimate kinase [Candidatus Nanopelagicales bacterium]